MRTSGQEDIKTLRTCTFKEKLSIVENDKSLLGKYNNRDFPSPCHTVTMGSHRDRDEELLLSDKYLGYIIAVTYGT